MTIEDIFKRGDIGILTRNICMANELKTLKDLELHYVEGNTFSNLRYCDEKSNDELIAVYNKYKEVYIEGETTQPPDSINESVVKLEDVVTDFDEVIKTNMTANASLKQIEQKLKEYWIKQESKEFQQDNATGCSVKSTLETATTDLRSIEQKLEEYWSNSAETEAPPNKNIVLSNQTISNVADVVDLEKIKDTITQYWNEKTTLETRTEELEQKLREHWRKTASVEATENDTAESSLKSVSEATKGSEEL